ncbi:hypothetical protein [Bacillus subtilis]|uniref:hypothetical protein n=1 Tax=Bacillus subtilis TaxID=1423 RepID=UPI003F83EAEF
MNNLSVTLTQSTIENYLRAQLANIAFQNEEETLYDDNGIKIIANVHVRKIGFDDFVLSPPNTFEIRRLSVEFEKLNIVVSADLPGFSDRQVIDIPDLPDIRDPFTGRVIVEGREVPDIVLWDVNLFGEDEDIKLTLGLEEIVKPVCSASFNFIINGFNVSLGLNDFEMNDFVIPESIADTVKNNIIEEVKKKIREAVGNNDFGKLIEKIGDLLKLIPIPDITGLIIEKVVKSDQFEQFVAKEISSKLGEYVLYMPQQFKLGTESSPIELSINPPTVNVIENNRITISVDVNEL